MGSAASIYYTRDPDGRLISERRTPAGGATTSSYPLLDGDGSIRALEDPGTVVDAYVSCPTGNPGDPDSGVAAAGNPWRHWGAFYEPGTKDYVNPDGRRVDSDSLNATQAFAVPTSLNDPTPVPALPHGMSESPLQQSSQGTVRRLLLLVQVLKPVWRLLESEFDKKDRDWWVKRTGP